MAKKRIPPFVQADDYFAIVTNDTPGATFAADTTNNPNAYPVAVIYVGSAGSLAIVSPTLKPDGTETVITFVAVPAGAILPVIAKRINATGTTASNLIGMVGPTLAA